MIFSAGNQKHINNLLLISKWLVLVLTYCFLGYKLYTFKHYSALWQHFQQPNVYHYIWLVIVILLLPLNIFLETVKWQHLVAKSEIISFKQALNAVLAGFSTGFVTPNRIGEVAGRMLYISPGNRKAAILYSFLNSLTQNYVIALVGIPAAIIYLTALSGNAFDSNKFYLILVSLFVLFFTVFQFFIPPLLNSKFVTNKLQLTADIAQFSVSNLLYINAISLARFLVFSFQFYVILLFFGVDITVFQALICIPTSYLLVTFTPSLALSEAAIRSSYAVTVIGFYAPQTAGIALAGLTLWLLNFGIPMLFGNRLILKSRI
jgi:hypothetical protein